MMPFLVDWWATRLYYEQEARNIAHQERTMSAELMTTYNRPQAVVNLQQLHDDVLWHVGAFRQELNGPLRGTP